MGKRKKKNRAKQGTYTKKQFKAIACKNCGLCDSNNPKFCYGWYKRFPMAFFGETLEALTEISTDPNYNGPNDFRMIDFQKTFCEMLCRRFTSSSETVCNRFTECFALFKRQIKSNKKEKKIKNKRKKYICAPYATFFSSDDIEWRDSILAILEENDGGDNE